MTITEPLGAVSTKCDVSLGADLSEPDTNRTVYAGPHSRVSSEPCEEAGESIRMSGICPPCGSPSLMSASDISQDENVEREDWGADEEDIVRRIG